MAEHVCGMTMCKRKTIAEGARLVRLFRQRSRLFQTRERRLMIARQLLRFGEKLQDFRLFLLRLLKRHFKIKACPCHLPQLQGGKAHAHQEPPRDSMESHKTCGDRKKTPPIACVEGRIRLFFHLEHKRLAYLSLIFPEPMRPDLFIRRFEMEHVACGVHKGRRLHARAQGTPQDGERLYISGKRTRFLHIFVRRMRTASVGKTEICQNAHAEACAMAHAHPRDDGHAHVECVARRTTARVWECIERDIDLAVCLEVLCRMAFHLDACEVDARRLDAAERLLPAVHRIERCRLEEEARARHGAENLRPEMQHPICDLREVVEAAERNIALLPRGQRRDSRFSPRTVAKVALGQAQKLLCKTGVVFPNGIGMHVRQEVVDSGKSRRIEVANTRDLHRCRTQREHGKRVVCAVPREVKEDVDLIGANPLRNLCGSLAAHIAPSRRMRRKLLCHRILTCKRVAENLEAGFVEVREKGEAEECDDMEREVGRDVADANLLAPLRRSLPSRHVFEKLSVASCRIEQEARLALDIVQGEEVVAP